MTVQFEAGRTYWTRSICDHNCIIKVTIARRTAKTVVTDAGKRFRVDTWEGAETISPWGSYSMAPTLKATDTRELKPDWEM